MESKKWWQEDWTDELALLLLGAIGILVVLQLGGAGSEIISGLVGGIVGYIKGKPKK